MDITNMSEEKNLENLEKNIKKIIVRQESLYI